MRVAMSAAAPAMTGASSAGTATFDTTPVQSTPLVPTAASTAPMMPPMSAWLDDDGMPRYHVKTFQTIAPTSPAKMISSVTSPWVTIPLAIVAATLTERNAPTKFSTEASPTATRGRRAPVAMVVAIAFAVS